MEEQKKIEDKVFDNIIIGSDLSDIVGKTITTVAMAGKEQNKQIVLDTVEKQSVVLAGSTQDPIIYRRKKYSSALAAIALITGSTQDHTLPKFRNRNRLEQRSLVCLRPDCHFTVSGRSSYCSAKHAMEHKEMLKEEHKETQRLIKENKNGFIKKKKIEISKVGSEKNRKTATVNGRKPTGSPNWKNNKTRRQIDTGVVQG